MLQCWRFHTPFLNRFENDIHGILMSNQLTVVQQQDVLGQPFKVYGTVEDPLFLAKDVAEWIEHNQPSRVANLVDEDEKDDVGLNDAIGRTQNTSIINESGLYSLGITSRKPQAKAFKKWITSDVIPTIRKTGAYFQADREEEAIHKYFPNFSEEVKKAMVLDLRSQNKHLKTAEPDS
ncbi:BRO family protein [Bacillus cereus]|uniref:BRO-N domain-containing protein n=1 Tax=Bacillus cereus TaxID=1396 RepID=UPI0028530BE5|nr:BRO family protein [Bacillus cereus]MDR4984631.1 BRO family protein [Bacillus cereus]